MNSLIQFLSGKKTYLASLAGVALTVAISEGWIHLTQQSVTAICTFLGIAGLRGGIAKASGAQPVQVNVSSATAALLAIGVFGGMFLWTACAPIQPGADPLVVQTERFETIADGTFDLVLKEDNSNRPFWRTNAPAFHQFCEWLRTPQTVTGNGETNNLPRCSAMILSLDNVKLDYLAGRAGSNDLATAAATLRGVVSQASGWLNVVTNNPTH